MNDRSSPAVGDTDSKAVYSVGVDLHCHLLPAWDDGARDLNESLEMARHAAADGVRTIVTTPHVGRAFGSRVERPAAEIAAAIPILQEQIDAAGIAIEVVAGAEVTLESLLESFEAAKPVHWPALTVGGQNRYILLESAYGQWPLYADRVLYQVALSGLTPIIAHPERLPEVQQNVHVLDEALHSGAVLQLTARALLGRDGPRVQACCRRLLQIAPSVILASDAHSSQSVWPGAAAETLVSWVGESAARHILSKNPQQILAGEPCRSLPLDNAATRATSKNRAPLSLWQRFWKR